MIHAFTVDLGPVVQSSSHFSAKNIRIFELRHEKTNVLVSDLVGLGSRGIVLSV